MLWHMFIEFHILRNIISPMFSKIIANQKQWTSSQGAKPTG